MTTTNSALVFHIICVIYVAMNEYSIKWSVTIIIRMFCYFEFGHETVHCAQPTMLLEFHCSISTWERFQIIWYLVYNLVNSMSIALQALFKCTLQAFWTNEWMHICIELGLPFWNDLVQKLPRIQVSNLMPPAMNLALPSNEWLCISIISLKSNISCDIISINQQSSCKFSFLAGYCLQFDW